MLWTGREREGDVTFLLCSSNSLSLIDSVSLGRAAVSEKVNLGWPSRLGQSGIRAAILWFGELQCSWDPSGSHFKRREERSLVSGILFPRQWATFLTPAELVKHHGRFPLLSPENQDSNLMLPPLNLCQGSRQSKLITTQTLSRPPCVTFKGCMHWLRCPTKVWLICQRRADITHPTESKHDAPLNYKVNKIKKSKQLMCTMSKWDVEHFKEDFKGFSCTLASKNENMIFIEEKSLFYSHGDT